MIDYKKVTLSVFDYSGNKVGILYSPDISYIGQASDIKLTHESNGWKELSFTIPQKVDGQTNSLTGYLVNEYLVKLSDGTHTDVFIISEPSIQHNNSAQTITVKCNHKSARLRMKKLYLVLDDTNGIGNCTVLANLILQGTGWSLGIVDNFYEPDGETEKIRTLASSGKEGAYQLIGKLCELFNARPVFHGEEQTVDLLAFAPYTFTKGEKYPTLDNPDALVELNYSKALDGVTRKLNTENLITRLYVEGAFGDDGYMGIEKVNPDGTNFLMSFDYFKAVGLFTEVHQQYVDNYISALAAQRSIVQSNSLVMSAYETELMDLWGSADYGVYDITTKINDKTFDVAHVTSLGTDIIIEAGHTALVMLSGNTHHRTKVSSVTGSRIVLETDMPSGMTATSILIYRTLASGKIGGKEVAAEAAQETYDGIVNRYGDNLIAESDAVTNTNSYLVKRYLLTENWQVGEKYTLSIWGTTNTANALRAWRDNGTTALPEMTYDTTKRCWIATFTCPDTANAEKNVINIYNYPQATASSANVSKIKLEFGETSTPWSPANNTTNEILMAEYQAKILGLYNGNESIQGIYELTKHAEEVARLLGAARTAYNTGIANINSTETTFAENMGDLLRDGYWQDSNYTVGQEQSLYDDAIKTHEVMSKPVADYQVDFFNMVGIDAVPLLKISINTPVHIIDDEVAINAWGYVDQVVYCLDMPYQNTLKVSTQESRFSGQSFTQILSQIAETARDVRDKKSIFGRASLISKDGQVSTNALAGVINTETNRLLSVTSNWSTDSRGNIVFTSQDGSAAMMLTGEGFMIANSKTTSGDWNWKTFGTGAGFTADLITAGTLQAGIVKILGTDQFYWDADNIYIFDPTNPQRQIRMGRYDGVNYGIGFTQDDGANWVSAFGFDGVNLNYASMDVSNVTGIGDVYVSHDVANDPDEGYATKTALGSVNSVLEDLDLKVRQNILFTAGGIIIKQQDVVGGFNSRYTSTAIEFYEGEFPIGEFRNRSLSVDNVIAKKQSSTGSLIWYVNGDGSVSAKWGQ